MASVRRPWQVRVFGIPSASPIGPASVPLKGWLEVMTPVVRTPFSPGCIRSGDGFDKAGCSCPVVQGKVRAQQGAGLAPRAPPGRPKPQTRGARPAPARRPVYRPNRPVAPLLVSHRTSPYTPSLQGRCSGVLKFFITFLPTRLVRTITDIVVGFIPNHPQSRRP